MTDVAPSKNAVYDQMELRAPKANPTFTGVMTAGNALFIAQIKEALNITGDGTYYNVLSGSTPSASWTEIIDRGNFSGGTFTAPATKQYLLCGVLVLSGITGDHTKIDVYINTSNRNYLVSYSAPASIDGISTRNFSFIADMDANDIAYLQVAVTGGSTKVVDLSTLTYFMGYALP